MPESPEVETVRLGLAPVMQGARFTKVEANRGDLRWPLSRDFARRLEGQKSRAWRGEENICSPIFRQAMCWSCISACRVPSASRILPTRRRWAAIITRVRRYPLMTM